jgi:hypothetical protein
MEAQSAGLAMFIAAAVSWNFTREFFVLLLLSCVGMPSFWTDGARWESTSSKLHVDPVHSRCPSIHF